MKIKSKKNIKKNRKHSRKNVRKNKRSRKNVGKYSRKNVMGGGLSQNEMQALRTKQIIVKILSAKDLTEKNFLKICKNKDELYEIKFESTIQIEVIDSYMFAKCESLHSITIPPTVTSIGKVAFSLCKKLETVTFEGSNLETIGEYAFFECVSLTSITIPPTVTSIGEEAFSKCVSLETITISTGVISIGEAAFGLCENLKTVTFEGSNLKTIGKYVFFKCVSLTSITIPSTVTSIGEEAFSDCQFLQTITIPINVESIGFRAFFNCKKLETVTFEKGSQLKSIGDSAFLNCFALKFIIKEQEKKLNVLMDVARVFQNCAQLTKDVIKNVFVIKIELILTITEKVKDEDYKQKEQEQIKLYYTLLMSDDFKQIQFDTFKEGYKETCEFVNGYDKLNYNMLSKKKTEIKTGIDSSVNLNLNDIPETISTLIKFINNSNNKNKKPFIKLKGSKAIDIGGVSKSLCGKMGEYLKTEYMKDLKVDCVMDGGANGANVATSAEVKDVVFDLNKKIFDVSKLKMESERERLSKVLYFFMFLITPLDDAGFSLNLNLSDFTLMILFDMFKKVGKKIRLSAYIDTIIEKLLKQESSTNANTKTNTKNTNTKNNNNNNNNIFYREDKKDPEFNATLFNYIGILCSLDESDIKKGFIDDFITNLNTKTYIKQPYMSFAQVLYIHLYGKDLYGEMKAPENISGFITLYETMRDDIKLLEQIGINIKTELECGVDTDDNSTCFSNNDDKLTLYELAHSVIQLKLSDIKIDKTKFVDKIIFKGTRKDDGTNENVVNEVKDAIKKIIGEFNDDKLRYFIRLGTGNIVIPETFTINLTDINLGNLIYAHTCFNTIDIPSFLKYKRIKALKTLRDNPNVANNIRNKKNDNITLNLYINPYTSPKEYYTFIQDTVFDIKNLTDGKGDVIYTKAGGKRKIKNTKKKQSKHNYLFNKSKKILHK